MEITKENKMGSTPMLKLILSMSLPAMFSMLIQALYNIVDSYFVAQLSESALTAVSLAFPLQMLVISVAVGTSIGINSLVSRRLGEKREEEASRAAGNGLLLSIASWVVFAIIGATCMNWFFGCFTKDATVVDMSVKYTSIVLIFSFGSFIEIAIEKTLQATGDMVHPMMFQLVGAITNIILDPIMIFGLFGFPAMGIAGAAIATVTGQIISMLYSIYVLFVKKHIIKITKDKFRPDKGIIKDIYAVGLPSVIMQSIGSVMTTTLNSILIAFSQSAVSVFGVYFKLQSFVFMPVFGLTHGVMPIMGYNFGAKNKKRLMSALKIGAAIAFVIMILGTLGFWLFTDKLLMIFNASENMLSIGVPALRIISLCFPAAALGIMFSTMFQAIGKGVYSLAISVLRQLVALIPLAFIFSKIGLGYVWLAFPCAEVFALIVSVFMLVSIHKKVIKKLSSVEISNAL